MPELPNAEPIVPGPRTQLRWFVNKLVSLGKTPIPIQEYDECICFPVDLLRKEETGLFPLGRYAGSVEFDSEDQEYAQYCKEMLEKIKRDIYKLKSSTFHYDQENFCWYEDEHNCDGNGYAFYLDSDDRPLLEAYLRFLDGDRTEPIVANNQRNKIYLQKTKKKQLQLPDLPVDLKWGEITIRFLNGDEVQITARELIYQASYELMGFQSEKDKKPTRQWDLLKVLSLKEGNLNWDNNKDLDTKIRDRVKKQKQELSEKLRVYFHTVKDDPFFDYKKENGYKIKMQLIPEQIDFKMTGSDARNYKDGDADTEDFFNEQSSDSNGW